MSDYDQDGKVLNAEEAGRCNLFVGNLPLSFDNESLKAMFAPYGHIVRCKASLDKSTGSPLGYGFVQFDTEDSAQRAISHLNGYKLGDRLLKVAVAESKEEHTLKHVANVYINNVPGAYSQSDLDKLCNPYGRIATSRLMCDTAGNSLGFGFVRFNTRDEAQKCIDALNNTIPLGGSKPLSIKFARDPSDKAKAEARMRVPPSFGAPFGLPSFGGGFFDGGAPGAFEEDRSQSNVYIANLPLTYTKTDLDNMASPYGSIINSCVLSADGVSRGIGLVRFDNASSASRAISALDGVTVSGSSAPLQVKLARDRNSRGGRGGGRGGRREESHAGGHAGPAGGSSYGPVRSSHSSSRYNPMAASSRAPPASSYAPYGYEAYGAAPAASTYYGRPSGYPGYY